MSWIKPELSGVAPPGRSLHVAGVMNNKLYIFGGWTPLVTDELNQGDQWSVSGDLNCLNLGKLFCQSGSVGRGHGYQSDGHGFESWLRCI